MKTHTRILGILLISLFFSITILKAQSYSYKGMYVYSLDSILNDATGKTADVLLRYCRDSSINALTLSVGGFNLNTSPSYVTKLSSFIKKGRSRYGVKYFSAVFSDYATLLNEIHYYQNSRTDSTEKFNYYNYEFEYWNNNFYTATGSSETAYCTKYLQPGGYSCDSVGAWNYFKKYIKRVDSLAQADNIKSSLYIGVKSKDTLKNRFIANTVDLIMIASYKSIPTDLYQSHTTGKFIAFSKASHKVDVIPIFSSLSQSATENLKIWLKVPPTGKHSESAAMPYFMSEYNLLSTTVRNNINLIGYQWFKYGGMPKDSSFTQIANIPSGLAATPGTTTAILNWNTVSGANQYTIWYAPSNTYAWTKINTTTNTTNLSALNSDSPYQFLVFAKTTTGNTASSLIASFNTNPLVSSCPKATGMGASAVTSSSATLTWTQVTGAISYNLRYKSVLQTVWITLSVISINQTISALSPSTNYEFQVQTVCSSGLPSDFTESVNFATTALTCGVPSALTSSAVTTVSATLAWTLVNGATGYVVAYRTGSSANWINQNTAVNSINLSGLTPAAAYEFQVQTVCSATNSGSFSPIATFTTANPVCAVPSGLNASSISTNSAIISWTGVQYSTSYILQYRIKGTSIWTSANSTGTSITISGLLPSSIYEYGVQTYCSTNNSSAFTSTNEFTTLNNCNPPSGISSVVNSSSSATINWQADANALNYKVEYKPTSATTWNSTATTSTLSQILSALTSITTYDYRLQSVCLNSSSAYSNSAQFTTPATTTTCAIPAGLSVSSVSSTSATLNWLAVSGASSYKVQYRKVGTSVWTNKTTSNNYKAITSLKTSVTYEFQVQTICSGGTSSYSSPSTFTTLGSTSKLSSTTTVMRSALGITINWTSPEENNASYYLIERSEDGLEFEPFRTIPVIIDNFNGSNYEINDNDYALQTSTTSVWYKLSVVDNDGNLVYLRTIEVLPKTGFEDVFKIYPNPNDGDQINLEVKVEKKEELLVVLLDIYGKTVYSKVIVTDDNGTIATAINPSQDLAKGIYQVVGYSSTKTLSQKLIVK